MKNLLKLFVLLFSIVISFGQNNLDKTDDFARIQLSTFVSEKIDGFPSAAKNLLKNKLSKIATMNGLGGTQNSRFIITSNISVLFQEVLPGPPRKVALTLEVNFYIGDGIEGTLFSSETMTIKGVGNSDTKAYIAALKQIKTNNPIFENFINNGKTKIIEYYNDKCDFILKNAEMQANKNDFDAAIATLTSIPEVCKECYDKAMDLSSVIYKRKIENECQQNLTKSNSLIAQDNWEEAAVPISSYTPDMSCYSDVKQLLSKIGDHKCSISLGKAKGAWARRDSKSAAIALSEISFDSSCYQEGVKLFKSISTELDAKAKQEWDLKYEKYNRDQMIKEVVAESQMLDADSRRSINETISETNRLDAASQRGINELNAETQRKINSLDAESRRKVQEEMVNVEKRRIDAMRDVGEAYGKNQPQVVYNIRGWW